MRKFFVLLFACTCLETTASTIFTDWSVVDVINNSASGSLGGVSVALTGSDVDFGVTNGSYAGFNQAHFAPPLALSDLVGVLG
ncbi:MAG: hypothetical protein ABL994_17980, partial [Verrucomicrobiales bacterium]